MGNRWATRKATRKTTCWATPWATHWATCGGASCGTAGYSPALSGCDYYGALGDQARGRGDEIRLPCGSAGGSGRGCEPTPADDVLHTRRAEREVPPVGRLSRWAVRSCGVAERSGVAPCGRAAWCGGTTGRRDLPATPPTHPRTRRPRWRPRPLWERWPGVRRAEPPRSNPHVPPRGGRRRSDGPAERRGPLGPAGRRTGLQRPSAARRSSEAGTTDLARPVAQPAPSVSICIA